MASAGARAIDMTAGTARPRPPAAGALRGLLFAAAWVVVAGLVLLHTLAVRDTIAFVDGLGRRGEEPTAIARQHVIPGRYADTQTWVRHAHAARENGAWRVRTTMADNAPHGREVHWAAPVRWLVSAGGWLRRLANAESPSVAVERALVWLNAPVFVALGLAIWGWIARRMGVAAGVLAAFAMAGHGRFYDGFAPANVDHHGLLTAAVFGLLLGIAFMGGGWCGPASRRSVLLPSDPARARFAAVISALCGAAGMWLSAASMIPAIALAGAGGLAVAWGGGRAALRSGATFDAQSWRIWGRVGALASALCYIFEYAPEHLGWRLEVNHPLHALAWWGGAEAVAVLANWRLSAERAPAGSLFRPLILPVLAVAAAPLAILVAGAGAFVLRDPFVGELRHFVIEGQSSWAALRRLGWSAMAFNFASAVAVIAGLVSILWIRDESRPVVALVGGVAAAFVALAFWEVRWWSIAGAAQLVFLILLFGRFTAGNGRARWVAAGVIVLGCFLPSAVVRIVRERADLAKGVIKEYDLLQPLYRDVARALRATQPDGEIVLLASPNASIAVGYYGGFSTLGTLFWENTAGLKAAAAIFSARTDAGAAELVRARGVTHVALFSTADFLQPYFQLLHPHAGPSEADATFGHRLAQGQTLPRWLQPVAYRRPADLDVTGENVRLFRVDFSQRDYEWWFHRAVALAARNEIAAAEDALAAALANAPAGAHLALCEGAGSAFYDYGADAAAVRAFRRALAIRADATIANTVAWILATTNDTGLRDGAAALALAERVSRAQPDEPAVLSTLAAAFAEVGRFADAVRAGERALLRARASGDSADETLLARRLDAYRAQRAWRQ